MAEAGESRPVGGRRAIVVTQTRPPDKQKGVRRINLNNIS